MALTDDGGEDDDHEGGEHRRRTRGKELADGRHEVDGGGGGDRHQHLHRDDHVHLADERPPQLRALDHVRAQAAAAGDREAAAGLHVELVMAIAHRRTQPAG
jgi:hypothetical protein